MPDMAPALRPVELLRAFWSVAAAGAACPAAGPALLGQSTPSQIGQVAVCAGAFLKSSSATRGREPAQTNPLVAPYGVTWMFVLAGFGLQAPGWLR